MLFKSSDIAVINKIDLIDVMDVNIEEMIRDAEKINPNLKIFTISALTEENIQMLINELFI
jgi:Ni2+-binding GTPase involved in maturation of urease and hydrogenase